MLIIGHRGAPSIKHENTIESFQEALNHNVDGLEFDIQLTQDNQLVVFHDFEILNLQNQTKLISAHSLKDIQKTSTHYQIPTFEDVIKLCPPNKVINIEIKSNNLFNQFIVFKMLQILKKYSLYKNIIISSFNPFVLLETKKQDSKIKLGLLWSRSIDQPWFITHYSYYKLSPYSFHASINYIDQQMVDWVKAKKMKLFLYTVNTAMQREKAYQLGADGIFSDYPNILEL
tara:strand:+ start:3039 stop:3728 length:690 start_codon:yes stop_codon:yes gene_type:complete